MITLKLDKDNFSINNTSICFPIEIDVLDKLLPGSKRMTKKEYNIVYTWDDLGITARSKSGKLVESLTIELSRSDYDFSPKQIFKGQFYFDNEDVVTYYKNNKKQRVRLFDGDTSGALVLNNTRVWFSINSNNKNIIDALVVAAFTGSAVEIPKDKYTIKPLDEEIIEFADFGFKLAVVQVLMYKKELLKPMFNLYEFVQWYDKREIDIEEEGYDPIPEVTQYFKDLPVPKKYASEITEIYQDGGNKIYLQLLRFGDGSENYWDMETAVDAKQFPNLKKAVLCYAKDNVLDELKQMGIDAEWM